jgi:hypothetical protein
MKKKVNADAIASELAEGSAFFRQAREQDAVVAAVAPPASQPAVMPARAPAIQTTAEPTSRPASESASQSTRQSTKARPARRFDTSPILGRPKSFYITDQQDKELDTAVVRLTERLQGRGNQKIDRSTVMRLLLEVSDVSNDDTVDRLADQLVNRLVSQLTG